MSSLSFNGQNLQKIEDGSTIIKRIYEPSKSKMVEVKAESKDVKDVSLLYNKTIWHFSEAQLQKMKDTVQKYAEQLSGNHPYFFIEPSHYPQEIRPILTNILSKQKINEIYGLSSPADIFYSQEEADAKQEYTMSTAGAATVTIDGDFLINGDVVIKAEDPDAEYLTDRYQKMPVNYAEMQKELANLYVIQEDKTWKELSLNEIDHQADEIAPLSEDISSLYEDEDTDEEDDSEDFISDNYFFTNTNFDSIFGGFKINELNIILCGSGYKAESMMHQFVDKLQPIPIMQCRGSLISRDHSSFDHALEKIVEILNQDPSIKMCFISDLDLAVRQYLEADDPFFADLKDLPYGVSKISTAMKLAYEFIQEAVINNSTKKIPIVLFQNFNEWAEIDVFSTFANSLGYTYGNIEKYGMIKDEDTDHLSLGINANTKKCFSCFMNPYADLTDQNALTSATMKFDILFDTPSY